MAEGTDQGWDRDWLAQIVERSNDPIVVFDRDGIALWANEAVALLGWTPEAVVGRSGLELVAPHHVERSATALSVANDGYQPTSSMPFDILTPDGQVVECDVAPSLLGPPDAPVAAAAHLRPARDARVLRELVVRLLQGDRAIEVLDVLRALLYHRNESVRVAIRFVDEDGEEQVIGDVVDPGLTGGGAAGAAGAAGPVGPWASARDLGVEVETTRADLAEPEAGRARRAGLRDARIVPVVDGDGTWAATITQWSVEGGPPLDLDSYSVRLLAQLTDLVLRWRRQTVALERAATRDPLTGLPNRRALAQFDATGPRRDLGVLYIDLDRFKPVNDEHGHAAGDLVLRTVANRIQSAARPTDIVARLGGDEFGVVCPGSSRAELDTFAHELRSLLVEPIAVHGSLVTIGASIGAARGRERVEPLLARADRALYDAKASGRGTVRWADEVTG